MALLSDWSPKFVLSLKDYTPQKLFSDLLAGITVGLVALPQSWLDS
jgi:MFS superfamily sulfate permease-like transporter